MPHDIRDTAELDALAPPFVADKLRNVYLHQFWRTGTMQRLELLRTPAKQAARRLARLPYVGGPTAVAWVNNGMDSGAKVLAAEAAGTLRAKTGHGVANDYARLALEHESELLQDIRTEDHAPLMAAVGAAVHKAVPRRADAEDTAETRPEITLVGGAHRGKEACHDLDILVVLPVVLCDGPAHSGALLRALRALADDENVERDRRDMPRLVAGLAVDASVVQSVTGTALQPPIPLHAGQGHRGRGRESRPCCNALFPPPAGRDLDGWRRPTPARRMATHRAARSPSLAG